MKIKLATILLVICFVSACASFNEGVAELHLNKNISTGQELLDLQAALDKGIINQEEFDIEKEKILSGSETFEIDIEEFENFELYLEWKLPLGGNSGIFYHIKEGFNGIAQIAPEYQLIDDENYLKIYNIIMIMMKKKTMRTDWISRHY